MPNPRKERGQLKKMQDLGELYNPTPNMRPKEGKTACPTSVWSKATVQGKRAIVRAAKKGKSYKEVLVPLGVPKTMLLTINKKHMHGKCWFTPAEAASVKSKASRRHFHDRRMETAQNDEDQIVEVLG